MLSHAGPLARSSAALVLALLGACFGGAPSHQVVQDTTRSSTPQVLILGTHHLGGSGDFIGAAEDDILSPARQREVAELVDRLAAFRPTKIAVEVQSAADAALNARYRQFLGGGATLGRNEVDQIAARLAQRLQHRRLYAIDHQLDEDIQGVVQWAAQHGDTAFVGGVRRFVAQMQAANDSVPQLPLLETYRRQNSPAFDALHSKYLEMARVGSGWADVVAKRYERNLKIFANLARIAEPGDRILVIYGAGHGKLLREFVREAEHLELVDIQPYLAERR